MPFQVLDYDKISNIATTLDPSKPVFILNLMRFKAQATYPPSASAEFTSLPPMSGEEAYFSRYIATIRPMMGGGEIFFTGKGVGDMLTSLTGDGKALTDDGNYNGDEKKDGKWDFVGLIKYPKFQEFRDMVEAEVYKEKAMPHRVAAIKDYILVAIEEKQVA